MYLTLLNDFIVEAKSRTYVGGGSPRPSCRPGSHDIGYERGEWRYLDSYFGGTDFCGQETVWLNGEPIWAMNYFGHIIEPGLIDGSRAGAVIKAALSSMYSDKKRFLDDDHFRGVEMIIVEERRAYELDYRGGLIRL